MFCIRRGSRVTIRNALKPRACCLDTVGVGGSKPLAPTRKAWRNRRIVRPRQPVTFCCPSRTRFPRLLAAELRNRLTKYCAASGLSERTVIEDSLRKYLDATDDTALLLRRFDRVDRALAREHRDLELLSEDVRAVHATVVRGACAEHFRGRKAAARDVAETQYKKFAQHVGAQFAQGHRFIDDLPAEALGAEGDGK
jgi:hypothetical protein